VPHEIEDRAYGPDLTPDERAAIAARVSIAQPGVVLYREMRVVSPASLTVMFDALDALIATFAGSFTHVLELSATRRPDAASRATLRKRVAQFQPRVRHVCVVLGGDVVMNAIARLVSYSLGFRSVTFHDSLEDAMAEAVRVA
jgi:hypothetical protein